MNPEAVTALARRMSAPPPRRPRRRSVRSPVARKPRDPARAAKAAARVCYADGGSPAQAEGAARNAILDWLDAEG